MNRLFSLSAIFAMTLVACGSTKSTIGDWEKLGSKKVNFGLDKDVVHAGAHEGTFKKLKLVVTGGSLNMHKMTVVYKNGKRDKKNIRHNFSRNSDSRVIDLDGGNRFIKEIIFWYDTKNRSNKRATMHVYGKH